MKKVMLIRPPYTQDTRVFGKWADFPLGLAYVAATLEKAGLEVSILDALAEGYDSEVKLDAPYVRYGLSSEEIADRMRSFRPDIIGASCLFTTQSENAHRVLSIAKKALPGVLTVMGGAHPSAVPEETLRDSAVDTVVIGEGEYTMRDIACGTDFSSIDGLAYRKDGKVRVNPKTRYIENIDELPLPARHLLDINLYFRPYTMQVNPRRAPAATMITSRGCPAKCIFCSVHVIWGRKFRARSVKSVMGEVRYLKERYNIAEIHFQDDNMTLDRKRAVELFDGLRDFGISWLSVGTAAWALDEELLKKMKESGCYRIYLPVESGDERVLREIVHKPLDLKKIPQLVRAIKSLGMEVHGFFIVGFPDETPKQVERTLRYARRLGLDDLYLYYATPYPGTEMYDICRKKGYIGNIDYRRLGPKDIHIVTPSLSAKRLRRMVKWHNIMVEWIRFAKEPIGELPVILSKASRHFRAIFEKRSRRNER